MIDPRIETAGKAIAAAIRERPVWGPGLGGVNEFDIAQIASDTLEDYDRRFVPDACQPLRVEAAAREVWNHHLRGDLGADWDRLDGILPMETGKIREWVATALLIADRMDNQALRVARKANRAAIDNLNRAEAAEGQLAKIRAIAAEHDSGRGECVCPLCSVLGGEL